MKPIAKIVAVAICLSVVPLDRLAVASQPQQPKPVDQQMSEMTRSQEINDGQDRSQESVRPPSHAISQQQADSADQPDHETAESPNGDGDGETNDDG
jgi:hypothetical protein